MQKTERDSSSEYLTGLQQRLMHTAFGVRCDARASEPNGRLGVCLRTLAYSGGTRRGYLMSVSVM